METVTLIFSLLIIYQIKHFIADYPLQGQYMLGKFKPDWGFFWPLAAHAGVHGLMTLGIVWYFNPSLWWLALVDAGIHFVMDRVKAGPKYLGRYKALAASEFKKVFDAYTHSDDELVKQIARQRLKHNVLFWWALGFDQMVHHLTHYYVIYVLVLGTLVEK